MKKLVFVLLTSFLFLGCNNNEKSSVKSACSVDNPIEDLVWLKKLSTALGEDEEFSKYNYIVQSDRNNETLFIVANCCPTCNSGNVVFNCKGEEIGYIDDPEFPSDLLVNGILIWKSKDNECDK